MLGDSKADKTILKIHLRIFCLLFIAYSSFEIYQILVTGQFSTKGGETILLESSPFHYKFELIFNIALLIGGIAVFIKAPVQLPGKNGSNE